MKKLVLTSICLAVYGALPMVYAEEGQGHAEKGREKAAMCIGCHGIAGYQASFPEVHRVPMISGQNNAYIVAALNAYKKGDRKHPTMRAIAGSLSDQDIADLAAFYATNATTSPLLLPSSASPSAWAGAAADLLKKGNCASCHGTDFNHPIDGSYPKLAGQYGDYLFVALKAYGTENNDKVGRAHPIMSTQVKPFSHAELKVLADYLGSLPGTLETVPQSKFR